MGQRAYIRVASDSGSTSDEDGASTVPGAGRPRVGSSLRKNRSRLRLALGRCSLRSAILFLSLAMNVVLVVKLIPTGDSRAGATRVSPGSSSQETTPFKPEIFTETTPFKPEIFTETTPFKPEIFTETTPFKPEIFTETTYQSNGGNSHEPCPPKYVPDCDAEAPAGGKRNHNSPARVDNIFEDLSLAEISSVYGYMASQADIGVQPAQASTGSHVYSIELHVPNKTDAIKYLDRQGTRPAREAIVIVERSDLPEPVTEEYVVGPLPIPRYHYPNPRRDHSRVPYRYHPWYGVKAAYLSLFQAFPPELHTIVEESYGATLVNCSHHCLVLLPQRTSSAYSESFPVVLSAYYATDFTTINPIDLSFIMKETSPDSQDYALDMMFYAGQMYKTFQAFITTYRANSGPKARMKHPRPAPGQSSNAGTMNPRGRPFPAFPQAGPRQFDPEGKRYTVTGQQVQYLEWAFSFRMSTSCGPQVWDVSWAGERVAYEISLQEVAVLYAGANPKMFYSHLSDSAFGLGDKATGLVPGVDCPEHATFLPQNVFLMDVNGPKTLPNAFCLFEHNTGLPLRRHRSNDDNNDSNYGGLVDSVLILRTIIVEYNYDYILDLVFHQNGAIQVKAYATGYVISQVFHPAEAPFGFRIHENVVGSIHHHVINFKIDLDIQGQANRYETLDFVLDDRPWPWHRKGKESFQQISFRHNLRRTEQEAVWRYNFSAPKYHIVYNEKARNKFGNHRAYRIAATGLTKQILPDDSPVLRSRSWSKYQMVATKRKDEEESSSSIYSMFDGERPHVDIDRYLEDDENIVDQDLVFWVTVGFHHLPHTEDIPNTPTVGAETVISLLPYNYFPECPSVGSRDALRLDLRESGVQVQGPGAPRKGRCLPPSFDYSDLAFQKSSLFA